MNMFVNVELENRIIASLEKAGWENSSPELGYSMVRSYETSVGVLEALAIINFHPSGNVSLTASYSDQNMNILHKIREPVYTIGGNLNLQEKVNSFTQKVDEAVNNSHARKMFLEATSFRLKKE